MDNLVERTSYLKQQACASYYYPLNPISSHFWLHHTVHCAEKITSACTSWLLGLAACERAMVGTGWANSHPCCIDRLRKYYSYLVEGSFLARKAAWALSSCLTTDYCLLINQWAWSRSRVGLLRLEVDLGSVFKSERLDETESNLK